MRNKSIAASIPEAMKDQIDNIVVWLNHEGDGGLARSRLGDRPVRVSKSLFVQVALAWLINDMARSPSWAAVWRKALEIYEEYRADIMRIRRGTPRLHPPA